MKQRLRDTLNGIALGLSFFSILPISSNMTEVNTVSYRSMILSFPLVGLLLGGLVVLLFYCLIGILPLYYAVLVSSISYLILYGFLHLDSIGDVVDGWFAALSGKDIKAVMKEPHIGSMGVCAVVCAIILTVMGIAYLLVQNKIEVFLSVLILSRLSVIVGLYGFDFRDSGYMTLQLSQFLDAKRVVVAFIVYSCIVYALVGNGIWLLSLWGMIVVTLLILYGLNNRFGFLNGDCLGFCIVITEIFGFMLGTAL